MSIVWLALAVTLLVEVPIVAAFYRGHRLRMAIACAFATTATNLALNLVLMRTTLAYDPALLGGELVALLFEALVYLAVAPGRDVSRALAVSATANFASFAAGLLLF
jgi:hypothetical protein